MPEVLSPDQIASYNENGYLVLENRIPAEWINRIRDEIHRFETEAATMTASNDRLDLEDSHSAETPRLRRIKLPHTISDVVRDILAVGVLIDDMAPENGPLMVYPGSHKGPVYDHHVDGVFAGAILPQENGLDPADAVQLTGPAGSVSIHHGRIVHGSALNTSDRARRILFFEMRA